MFYEESRTKTFRGVETVNELQMLEKKIIGIFGDSAWLFPSKGNVKGFYGTGLCEKHKKRVMFVAESPSMGKIDWGRTKETIETFYEILERLKPRKRPSN